MQTNTIHIGVVKEIKDYDKAIIIFDIPNLVEGGLAYSSFTERKPKVGDEVVLFKMSSQLNAFWYYLKIDQTGQFTINYNGASFILRDNKIYIQANEVHINNKADGDNVTSGNESMVYGDALNTWLSNLIELLSYEYKVLTSMGPSMTATPDALAKLNKLKAELPKHLSGYSKILSDK